MTKFVLSTMLMLASVTLAQDEGENRMVTDRPSATDRAYVIDPGLFQLELGYTYRNENDEDVESHNFPQTSFRIGLLSDVDMRVGWGGYSFVDGDDIAQDTSLGLRWIFAEQDGWSPRLGVLGEITMPTGNKDTDVNASVILLWLYDLDDLTSLSGNLGVASISDDGDRFAQGKFTVMVSRALNEQTGIFAEYFTNFPAADDEDAAHSVDFGILYKLNDNFQLDAFVGTGLNDEAGDFFAGLGLAYRF